MLLTSLCGAAAPPGCEVLPMMVHNDTNHLPRVCSTCCVANGSEVVSRGSSGVRMTVGTTPPNGKQVFEVLCRHDSYTFGDDQRCHPHPSFTPDGRQVIFTSNRTGTSNIYLTDWD